MVNLQIPVTCHVGSMHFWWIRIVRTVSLLGRFSTTSYFNTVCVVSDYLITNTIFFEPNVPNNTQLIDLSLCAVN